MPIFRADVGTINACDLVISKYSIGSGLFGGVYKAAIRMKKNAITEHQVVSGTSIGREILAQVAVKILHNQQAPEDRLVLLMRF